MNFTSIRADIYRRCGFGTSPPSEVVTRINAFINETQAEILREPGMEYLLNDTITFASVTDQQTYGLPPEIAKIKTLRDTTNQSVLTPISLSEYRTRYPDPAAVTGTPEFWVDLGLDAITVEPSDASTLFVVSTSGSDTGTAYLEGFLSGGIPFTASVTMTGATAVSFTPTTILSVTKFFISAAAVGTVTLREDSGTGTILATLGISQTYARYRRIALAPTPSAALTYTLEGVRDVTDMVQDNDEPAIPAKYHHILAIGGRMKEYEKTDQLARWNLAKSEYAAALRKLKFWVYGHSAGEPNMRGFGFVRPSIMEGGSILSAGGSVTTPTTVINGGTGFSSYTIGDMLVADTTTTLAKLTAVADGRVLRGAGAGVVPVYSTFTIPNTFAQGDIPHASSTNTITALAKDATATRYLSNTGASNNPAWAQVNVANGVTGDLPYANLTQGSALSVLGVTGNATADVASIAAGADANILRRAGTALAFGSVDLAASGAVGTSILPVANGGTGLATVATDNLLTGAGTGALVAESTLTYDGTTLTLGSGQIAFPAVQNASAGANTLDDYEEGSWTPLIGGSTSESGQAYSSQVGRYIKVGRTCTVLFDVQLSTKGTITGDVQLKSLPFTSVAGLNQAAPLARWLNFVSSYVHIALGIDATAATLYGATAAATSIGTAVLTADIGDTSRLIGTFAYITNA